MLLLHALVSFGSELIKNREVHNPIRTDRSELFVHVGRHPDQIFDRVIRWVKCRLRVRLEVLIGKVHYLSVVSIQ